MILAGFSGALLTASFPNIGLSWLAWIALVPLMVSLKGQSVKNGFLLGLLTGGVHYLTLLYWLVHTLMTYGHLPFYLSMPILVSDSSPLAGFNLFHILSIFYEGFYG